MHVAVHLKQPTRGPARAARTGRANPSGVPPYLALLRAGFAVPCLLPGPRCALTAPFHPCQLRDGSEPPRRFGGLLSVALSVDSRPPGVTWRLALWSPDFPRPPRRRAFLREAARCRGCLADSRAHD